jgi:hypothetical protein
MCDVSVRPLIGRPMSVRTFKADLLRSNEKRVNPLRGRPVNALGLRLDVRHTFLAGLREADRGPH